MTTPHEASCCQPQFVVQEPFGRPRQHGAGEEAAVVPFRAVVEAEVTSAVDVRQVIILLALIRGR